MTLWRRFIGPHESSDRTRDSTLCYKVLVSAFDLLFLALALTTAVCLITAAGLALFGRFRRAWRVLVVLFCGLAGYMAIVIAVSAVNPRRVLKPDQTQCFDDWCIGIANFRQVPKDGGSIYEVDFQLSSRARRISQRENNLRVYMTDGRDARYDPIDAAPAPFNVLLGPQESVTVRRTFQVPAGAKDVGLVITHQGGFPIGWFIIGYDTWFRKPALIDLH